MAQIIWNESASLLLEAHLDYAVEEFGRKAVNNWYTDIRRIESRLSRFPKSFTPEPLLEGRGKEYRGAILMKNFKLIHYYDEEADIVYIDAIWDMRMSPGNLKNLI